MDLGVLKHFSKKVIFLSSLFTSFHLYLSSWTENGHASRAPWNPLHAKEATNDIKDAPDDFDTVTAWWPDGFSKQIPKMLSLTWREREKIRDNKRKGKTLKERHFEGISPTGAPIIVIDRNDKLLENGEKLIFVSLFTGQKQRCMMTPHDQCTMDQCRTLLVDL